MEISVALPDVADPHGLMQRLDGALDATVWLDPGSKEVRVRPEDGSPGVVMRVVAEVEAWLEQACVESARLTRGERSYTLIGNTERATP